MITSITPIAAAGGAAGLTLAIARLTLGNELDAVESQAVGIVAAGVALTGYATQQGAAGQQLVTAYWTIAAIAGIPPVLAYWFCRRSEREQQRARRAVGIAGRDFRGDDTGPALGAGHR